MIKYKSFYLIVVLFLISFLTQAQNQSIQNVSRIKLNGAEYYVHQVEKGEGLFRIAQTFNVSQDEIVKANPEIANGLKEGQVVFIPIIEGRNDNSTNISSNQQFVFHTIEKGQTAYFLSQKYRVTIDEIYKVNPEIKNTLQVGQVIRIPVSNQTGESNASGNKDFIVHTVSPDETIYSISKKYDISSDELVRINPGIANGIVKIGMQLKIPVKSSQANSTNSVSYGKGKDIVDQSYYYHYVKGGETIYSIAQKYNSTTDDILLANAGINASQLPYGYVIRVPKAPKAEQQSLMESDHLIDHKVAKRETLFGIAKKYNTEVDVIKKLNPAVDFSNLRKGVVLKVPTSKWIDQYYANIDKAADAAVKPPVQNQTIDVVNQSNFNYFDKKEVLKVAVLLPFKTNKSMNIADNGDEAVSGSSAVSGRTKIIVEFYEGILMALDKFKKQGVNIQLFVYDTGATIDDVKRVLQKPELTTVDLIIGPAHSDLLKPVSDFSHKYNIKMVNPFTTNNSELDVNPYMFQLTTPDSLLLEPISNIVVRNASNQKVIIIRSATNHDLYEQKLTEQIRSKIFWTSSDGSAQPEVVDVKYSENSRIAIEGALKKDGSNLIVVPSTNEVFVNQVINQLNAIYEKGLKNFTIVGLPNWLKFQTIDPESIHHMNGHIISYYGVDYSSPKTTEFIQSYQSLFHTEPFAFQPHFQKSTSSSSYSRYSIWGYDVATYFIGAMVSYGPQYETYFNDYHPSLIQSNFHFKRISNWGGFYNDGLMILNFTRDYTVKCIYY